MSVEHDLTPAREALQAKDYETAESIAKSVLENNPKAHKAYHILSLSAREQNDWQRAESAIQSALEIAPADPETLNSYGNLLSMTMRGKAARQHYARALEDAPNYLPPALALGQLLLREKDPVEAIEVFRSALQHNPKHPGLMMGLFYALKEAEQIEAAQALLQQLPPSPDLFLARGQLADLLDQKPIAETNYIQGLGHGPIAGQSFRHLVELTARYDDGDAAASRMEKIIKTAPDQGGFYLSAADILSDMGKLHDAMEMLDRCVKKFGNQPEISSLRAKLLILSGDGAAAFEIAEAVLKERKGDLAVMSLFTKAALMTERFDLALQASKAAQIRQRYNQFWIGTEAIALRGLGQAEDYKALYNYDNVQIVTLETPPEYDVQSDFLVALKEACLERLEKGQSTISGPLKGGLRTRRDLRFAQSRVLQDYFQALGRPLNAYINGVSKVEDSRLSSRKSEGYRLSEVWSDKLSTQDYYENHVQPSAWLNSLFCIDVDETPRAIKFGAPPFKVPKIESDFQIELKAGELAIYPSYMWWAMPSIDTLSESSSLWLTSLIVPS